MNINFPNEEIWDGNRHVILFPAEIDNKRIQCAISLEALEDNFGGHNKNPIDCFKANRGAIETKAEQLFRRGRFEPDGSIIILTRDGA